MKAAKQWCKENEQAWESGDGEVCTLIVVDETIVRQIQLDAMREGLRRASKHVYGNETHEDIEKAILTTAEQLTEKDLMSTQTKTLPTKPGAYWHRNAVPERGGAERKYLRHVQMLHPGIDGNPAGERCLCVAIHKNGRDENVPVGDMLGEWQGPLVPVDEVEKAWHEAAAGGPGYLWARYRHSRARKIVDGEQV